MNSEYCSLRQRIYVSKCFDSIQRCLWSYDLLSISRALFQFRQKFIISSFKRSSPLCFNNVPDAQWVLSVSWWSRFPSSCNAWHLLSLAKTNGWTTESRRKYIFPFESITVEQREENMKASKTFRNVFYITSVQRGTQRLQNLLYDIVWSV